MATITLLSTPLTRTIDFDVIEQMGVNLYQPIFSSKSNLIIGYPMTGRPPKSLWGIKKHNV